MICNNIGYYGSCMDGLKVTDILLFGIIALIFIVSIKIIINQARDKK
jgi:hypothetical protein